MTWPNRPFALFTVISLAIPPGNSSINNACSRHAALLFRSAQVAVPFRQQLQHLGMLISRHSLKAVDADRGDRHRAGIVRVVLLCPTRAQQPGPRRQRRRHVDHHLAGSDELLSKQVAEPACGLDRPHPIRERNRPQRQPLHLRAARSNTKFVEHHLVVVDRHGGVCRLVRIDTNHHSHRECLLVSVVGTEVGTPDLGSLSSRLFRATPRVRTPADRHFAIRSTTKVTGPKKRLPTGAPNATTTVATPPEYQSGPSAASRNDGAGAGGYQPLLIRSRQGILTA